MKTVTQWGESQISRGHQNLLTSLEFSTDTTNNKIKLKLIKLKCGASALKRIVNAASIHESHALLHRAW